jgi:hypothetical protein
VCGVPLMEPRAEPGNLRWISSQRCSIKRCKIIGREDVGSAPALLTLFCGGLGLGSGLGPGLACESADACWLSCESICRPGPRLFMAPTGAAGLICPSCARGRGSRIRAASGCVPSLNLRKGRQ